jgi:AcrR family transcriptional regulator
MKEHTPEAITSEMVLNHSLVSKGSLYHHFEDLGDLIETALVREFSSHVDQSIDALTQIVVNSKTSEEMWTHLEKITHVTQGRPYAPNRAKRVRLISLCAYNPRFAHRLAIELARLTDALTDLIRETQLKGWMNTLFDPRAAAVLIQAYTLGKVVDDVSAEQIDEEAWNSLIIRMVRNTFG